jgi:hypothetical protein
VFIFVLPLKEDPKTTSRGVLREESLKQLKCLHGVKQKSGSGERRGVCVCVCENQRFSLTD